MGNGNSSPNSRSSSPRPSSNPSSRSSSPATKTSTRPKSGIYSSLNAYINDSSIFNKENIPDSLDSNRRNIEPKVSVNKPINNTNRFSSPYRNEVQTSALSIISTTTTTTLNSPFEQEIKSILLELCQILDNMTYAHIPTLNQSSIIRKLLRRITVLIKLDNDSFYERNLKKITKEAINDYIYLNNELNINKNNLNKNETERVSKPQFNKGGVPLIKGKNFNVSRPLPSIPTDRQDNISTRQRSNTTSRLPIKNEKDESNKVNNSSEILPSLYNIISGEIIIELSIRAMNDNPRGILPLILSFLNTLLKSINYTSNILSSSNVYTPLKKLIFISSQYNLIINQESCANNMSTTNNTSSSLISSSIFSTNNDFSTLFPIPSDSSFIPSLSSNLSSLKEPQLEEHLFINSLKRNVDTSLLILLKTLWIKIREDPSVIKYYINGNDKLGDSVLTKDSISDDKDEVDILSTLVPFLFDSQELLTYEAQQTILIVLSIKSVNESNNINNTLEMNEKIISSINPIDYFFLKRSNFSQGIIGDLCTKYAEAVETVQNEMVQNIFEGEEKNDESDIDIEDEVSDLDSENDSFEESDKSETEKNLTEKNLEFYDFYLKDNVENENFKEKMEITEDNDESNSNEEFYDDDFIIDDINSINDENFKDKNFDCLEIDFEQENVRIELEKKWKEYDEPITMSFNDFMNQEKGDENKLSEKEEDWDLEFKNIELSKISEENENVNETDLTTKMYSMNYFNIIFSNSKMKEDKQIKDKDLLLKKKEEQIKNEIVKHNELKQLLQNKLKKNNFTKIRERRNIKSILNHNLCKYDTEGRKFTAINLHWLPPYLQAITKNYFKKKDYHNKDLIKQLLLYKPQKYVDIPQENLSSKVEMPVQTNTQKRYSLSKHLSSSFINSFTVSSVTSSSILEATLELESVTPLSSNCSTSLPLLKWWNCINFFINVIKELFDTYMPVECENYILSKINDDFIVLPENLTNDVNNSDLNFKNKKKKKKKIDKEDKKNITFPPRIIIAVRLLNYFNKWFILGVLRASLHKSVSHSSRSSSYALFEIILSNITDIKDKSYRMQNNSININSVILFKILNLFVVNSAINLYLDNTNYNLIESIYSLKLFSEKNISNTESLNNATSTTLPSYSSNIISSSLIESLNSDYLPLSFYSMKLLSKYLTIINSSTFFYQLINIKPFISSSELKKILYNINESKSIEFLINIYKDNIKFDSTEKIEDEDFIMNQTVKNQNFKMATDIIIVRIKQLNDSVDKYINSDCNKSINKNKKIKMHHELINQKIDQIFSDKLLSNYFIKETNIDLWRFLNILRYLIERFSILNVSQQINLSEIIRNLVVYLLSNFYIINKNRNGLSKKILNISNQNEQNMINCLVLMEKKVLSHIYSINYLIKIIINKLNEKFEEKLNKNYEYLNKKDQKKILINGKAWLKDYIKNEAIKYMKSKENNVNNLNTTDDKNTENNLDSTNKLLILTSHYTSIVLLEDLKDEISSLILTTLSLILQKKKNK